MDKRRRIPPIAIAFAWGLFVAGLILYLFFPYQKVLKVALQSALGGSRATIAMEGVRSKTFGIRAMKVLLRPDPNNGQIVPFEFSNVDISWSPLSLLRGSLSVRSKASFCDGSLRSSIDGVTVAGSSDPSVVLTLKGVNVAKCPEGLFPWVKGVSGVLDGVIRSEKIPEVPGKQGAIFRFTVKNGEIEDFRINNMPRLVVPYKEIIIEGKTDGTKIALSRISLRSDAIVLRGSGIVEPFGTEQSLNLSLSYEALTKTFPLKGSGTISIRGTQTAPLVSISNGGPEKAAENRRG
jgi:type II secretion system protein N